MQVSVEELGLTVRLLFGRPLWPSMGDGVGPRPGTREVSQLCGAKRAEAGPQEGGHRCKRLGQEEEVGEELLSTHHKASPCPLHRLAFVPFPRLSCCHSSLKESSRAQWSDTWRYSKRRRCLLL